MEERPAEAGRGRRARASGLLCPSKVKVAARGQGGADQSGGATTPSKAATALQRRGVDQRQQRVERVNYLKFVGNIQYSVFGMPTSPSAAETNRSRAETSASKACTRSLGLRASCISALLLY